MFTSRLRKRTQNGRRGETLHRHHVSEPVLNPGERPYTDMNHQPIAITTVSTPDSSQTRLSGLERMPNLVHTNISDPVSQSPPHVLPPYCQTQTTSHIRTSASTSSCHDTTHRSMNEIQSEFDYLYDDQNIGCVSTHYTKPSIGEEKYVRYCAPISYLATSKRLITSGVVEKTKEARRKIRLSKQPENSSASINSETCASARSYTTKTAGLPSEFMDARC